MRLVWVVIPLVLIGIVEVQESFAEEPKIIEIVYPIEQYVDSELIVKGVIVDKKNWNGNTIKTKVQKFLKENMFLMRQNQISVRVAAVMQEDMVGIFLFQLIVLNCLKDGIK